MTSWIAPSQAARPVDDAQSTTDRFSLASETVPDELINRFSNQWDRGRWPLLELSDAELGLDDDPITLSALVKAEMARRFARGDSADAQQYLARFPVLRNDRERVVSVVYEEFCLREENGLAPGAESFCERYADWADSLASQLRYHRMFSQLAGPSQRPKYPPPGGYFADRFRLRSILGEGGTARVYLAEQPECGDRPVALKVSAARSKEPSIQGRLDHAHIVPVWSVIDDEASGLRGLCMPYRPGRALDLVIRIIEPRHTRPKTAGALLAALELTRDGLATADDFPGWRDFPRNGTYCDAAAWVIARIARALGHAHSRGILHRDVKPANILLTNREGPQLLDFNLAHDPHSYDQAHAAMRGGTLPYMAPEQLHAFLDPEGWNNVGPQADIYSLALVLDELLTGERPASQPVDDASLPRIINEMLDTRRATLRSPRKVNPDVPHALTAVIAKCLHPDSAKRYARADDLAEDLECFIARKPLRFARNTSRIEVLRNALARSRCMIAITAAACMMAICLPLALKWLTPTPDVATVVRAGCDLVNKMDDELEVGDHNHASETRQRAINVLRQAVARDPSQYQAWLGLAHIAFRYDDFPFAVDLYDTAIDQMVIAKVKPASRVHPLINRANALNARGRQLQGSSPTRNTFLESLPYYQRALRDLNDVIQAAGGEVEDLKPLDEVRVELTHAAALMGMGDVETGACGQHKLALAYYELALDDCQKVRVALAAAQKRCESDPSSDKAHELPEPVIAARLADVKLREKEIRDRIGPTALDFLLEQ